jgi:hypothetical protein
MRKVQARLQALLGGGESRFDHILFAAKNDKPFAPNTVAQAQLMKRNLSSFTSRISAKERSRRAKRLKNAKRQIHTKRPIFSTPQNIEHFVVDIGQQKLIAQSAPSPLPPGEHRLFNVSNLATAQSQMLTRRNRPIDDQAHSRPLDHGVGNRNTARDRLNFDETHRRASRNDRLANVTP